MVVWNTVDSQLASGSSSGEIVLHSLVTGVSIANFKQKNSTGIKLLAFSPFKKQMLASCTENGSVYVWDCNTRNVCTSFQYCHHSPVTGLAFGPGNPALMCTTGLDQRVQFYDINEKRVIKTLETEAPLTCLDFASDGYTIAAGTLYGTVLVYDLRNSKTVLATLRGHEGTSVNWVDFAKKYSRTPTVPSTEKEPPVVRTDESCEIPRLRSLAEIQQEAKLRAEATRKTKTEENLIKQTLEVKEEDREIEEKVKDAEVEEETHERPQETQENCTTEECKGIQGRIQDNECLIQGLRDHVQTLHIELIRQFTIQQNEIRGYFETYSRANAKLLQEINQLKEENSRLKFTSF